MIESPRQAAVRHPDRTAAAFLAVLVVFLFAPAVAGQRVFFHRDILSYWYPHIENAVQSVAEGAWPTWTPYVAFGRPLLADPSLQLLYAPTWLNLLMPPAAYYTLFAVAHAWAAGFGLYLLGRGCALALHGAGRGGVRRGIPPRRPSTGPARRGRACRRGGPGGSPPLLAAVQWLPAAALVRQGARGTQDSSVRGRRQAKLNAAAPRANIPARVTQNEDARA